MLDPLTHQRVPFRAGTPIRLADNQAWVLASPSPSPDHGSSQIYDALILSIAMADNRRELLRAELALSIHLIMVNYELPPLLLGALLDFPEGDPEISRFQAELHAVAMEHVRSHRPPNDIPCGPPSPPRIHRSSGRLGIFSYARSRISA